VSGLGDRPAPRGARSIGVDLASDRGELVARSRLRREQARADGPAVAAPVQTDRRWRTDGGGRHELVFLLSPVRIPSSGFVCVGYDPNVIADADLPDWLHEALAGGVEMAA
jgi:hypothetical protein